MKNKLRLILILLLALICLGSTARIGYQHFQYNQGKETYAEAEQLAELPDLSAFTFSQLSPSSSQAASSRGSSLEESPAPVYVDPYADALSAMNFTALREVNEDILGWIVVPGTRLSYPLVQGEDNSYYLNRTWHKSRNSVGAIFLECANSPDLSDFNTIIYGHRMNNNSMFGTLKYYQEQSYWQQHPNIYITNDNGSHTYEIFAAYEVSVEGDTYLLGFPSDAHKQSFLDFCLEQSVIDTGVIPTIYDHILTLSTCTGNGHATRWVVQARLKGEVPAQSGEPVVSESLHPQSAPLPSIQTEPEPVPESVPSQDILEADAAESIL